MDTEIQAQRLSLYNSLSSFSSKYPKSIQYLKSHTENTKMLASSPRMKRFAPNNNKRSASEELAVTDEFLTSTTSAPTLPMHSPHSPLHPHSQVHLQTKLSARYINNKLCNSHTTYAPKKSTIRHPSQIVESSLHQRQATHANKNEIVSQNTNSRDTLTENKFNNFKQITLPAQQASALSEELNSSLVTSSASKLICSCEKNYGAAQTSKQASTGEKQSYLNPRSKNNVNSNLNTTNVFCSSKRLVATRNAATSPHLNVRKLTNVTIARTSRSIVRQPIVKKSNDTTAACKSPLEKSKSLSESKPQRLLRTTRSLSPRPPIRHQQAIIVSNENKLVSVKLDPPINFMNSVKDDRSKPLQLESSKNEGNEDISLHKRSMANCRSEQTSPNISDLSGTKFVYNQLSNRSTSCLVYIPTDPWLKVTDLDNPTSFRAPKYRLKNKNTSSNDTQLWKTVGINAIDFDGNPWIKREDSTNKKSPKQERFRQFKSFSTTKFEGANEFGETLCDFSIKKELTRTELHRAPNFTDDLLLFSDFPMQSAPSSPNFLKTLDNPISSAISVANVNSTMMQPLSPPRSASFSPARIKDSKNPFFDSGSPLLLPNWSPPSITVAAVLASEQQQGMDRSLLSVHNPNLLQARHSFSSSNNQQHEEELQLNIRRLSEQIQKVHIVPDGAMKMSASERNVSNGGNTHSTDFKTTDERPNMRGADFSHYLRQFRSSEAKKAISIVAACSVASKTNVVSRNIASYTSHSKSNLAQNPHKSQAQAEALLETSC